MEKSLIGPGGEKAAVHYLKREGYRILETNYRICGSEVDIIAIEGETLCFVEVKTRETNRFGLPEEFVDARKRRKIIRAAKVFIGKKPYCDYYVRFDIIAVASSLEDAKIRHIKHAFQEE